MYYNSAFQQYAKALSSSKYDPIPFEEERKLLLQFREQNYLPAFNSLVEVNLRFVIYVLKGMNIPFSINPMDLVQEGNLGLMAGIKKYDTKFSVKISTYAMSWIRFFISQSVINYNGDKHILFTSLPEVETRENGDRSKNKEKEIADEKDYLEVSWENNDIHVVGYVLNFLPDREKSIISLYYGLDYPYVGKSLKDIGIMLHLNFERVRQLRDSALQKLLTSVNFEEMNI